MKFYSVQCIVFVGRGLQLTLDLLAISCPAKFQRWGNEDLQKKTAINTDHIGDSNIISVLYRPGHLRWTHKIQPWTQMRDRININGLEANSIVFYLNPYS
jgi:hypothetical protein